MPAEASGGRHGGRAGGIPLMTLEYALRQAGLEPGVDVDVRSDVQFNLMAGAFIAAYFLDVSVILIILACGVIGAVQAILAQKRGEGAA